MLLVIAICTVVALVIMGQRRLAWELFLIFALMFGILYWVTHAG